jgi:hypothetical protein
VLGSASTAPHRDLHGPESAVPTAPLRRSRAVAPARLKHVRPAWGGPDWEEAVYVATSSRTDHYWPVDECQLKTTLIAGKCFGAAGASTAEKGRALYGDRGQRALADLRLER